MQIKKFAFPITQRTIESIVVLVFYGRIMRVSVRCYLLDEDNNVLLVRHDTGTPRVLPWGHVEKWDKGVHDALQREVHEELGIDISLIGVEQEISDDRVATLPLPVSMYVVRYEHRTKWLIEKLEYLFFARAQGDIESDENEIVAYERMSIDDVLVLDDTEIPRFFKEVLEQNIDLLEIIG